MSANRLERTPLRRGEAVARSGSSSSRRRSAGATNGRLGILRADQSASADGSGAQNASQIARAMASVSSEARARAATASRARRRSAPPGRGTPACRETHRRRSAPAWRRHRALARARRAAAAGRRGRARTRARPASRRQRLDELPVAPLERREQRASAAPAAAGEERGADPTKLRPRSRRHRPLVEDVLPGQHGAAERRLPKCVAGALAVRDMQQQRTCARLAAAAGEVRGAAGAVVERAAGAADDARELLAHPPQRREP